MPRLALILAALLCCAWTAQPTPTPAPPQYAWNLVTMGGGPDTMGTPGPTPTPTATPTPGSNFCFGSSAQHCIDFEDANTPGQPYCIEEGIDEAKSTGETVAGATSGPSCDVDHDNSWMYYYDGVGGDSYSKYVWDLDPDPAAGATITMDFLYEVDDVISDWGGEKEIILYNLAASGSGLCGFGVNPDDLGTTGHEVTLHSESTASSTSGEDWIDDDTQYCIRLVCTTADDDVEVWIDATGGGATDLSDCGQTSAHTHNGGGSNTDVGTLVLGLQRINKSAIYIDNIEVSW